LEIGGNFVVRNAIFGNVGTMIIFRVGASDAEFLAPEFFPRFTEEDLVNLPKYNVYLKLMIDGVSSDPFSAGTLPPISRETSSAEKVIKVTRERYSEPRDVVEDKIAKWSGVETEAMIEKLEKEIEAKKFGKVIDKDHDFLKAMNGHWIKEEEKTEKQVAEEKPAEKEKEDRPSRPSRDDDDGGEKKEEEFLNIVKCDSCGVKTKINFNPDPSRPIFCKDCLKDYRRKQAMEESLMQRRTEQKGPGQSELKKKMQVDKQRKRSSDKPRGDSVGNKGGSKQGEPKPKDEPQKEVSLSELKS